MNDDYIKRTNENHDMVQNMKKLKQYIYDHAT